MVTNLGLNLELKETDNTNSSDSDTDENDDWGIMISRIMKAYPAMDIQKVLDLSYPQFKALYINIFNEKTFSFVIPYLGSSSDDETDQATKEVKSKAKESNIAEISSIVSAMNRDFMQAGR